MTAPTELSKDDLIAEVRTLLDSLKNKILYGVIYRKEEYSCRLHEDFMVHVQEDLPRTESIVEEIISRYEDATAPAPADPPPAQDPPPEG